MCQSELLEMQASAYAVRGGVSLDSQKRRVLLPGSGDFRKRSLALNNLCTTTGRSDCFGLRLGSVDMAFEPARARAGVFRSPAKARSVVRAQASGLSFFAVLGLIIIRICFTCHKR